jgi:hypothetical protein
MLATFSSFIGSVFPFFSLSVLQPLRPLYLLYIYIYIYIYIFKVWRLLFSQEGLYTMGLVMFNATGYSSKLTEHRELCESRVLMREYTRTLDIKYWMDRVLSTTFRKQTLSPSVSLKQFYYSVRHIIQTKAFQKQGVLGLNTTGPQMYLSTLSRKVKEYILIVLQAFTLHDEKSHSYFRT